MMIENYRSGLVWNLMRECPCLVAGLKRAGFQGGWLDHGDGAVYPARAGAETDNERFDGKATG